MAPRVWVTGARGFVGRHLCAHLSAQGWATQALSREAQPGCWALGPRDGQAWRQALAAHGPPEAVVHLAGFASVGRSWGEPEACWQANLMDALPMMEALAAGAPGTKLLVASSGEVYGPDRSLSPESPYGASKLALEAMALQVGRSSRLQVVVARAFNQVGPGQAEHFAIPSWAHQVARAEVGRGPTTLQVGNLAAQRDLIDVRDVASGMALLLERAPAGSIWDLGHGQARPMGEALQALMALAKVELRLEVAPERLRPADAGVKVADPGPLLALGWRPEHGLAESMADVLAEARRSQPLVGDFPSGHLA